MLTVGAISCNDEFNNISSTDLSKAERFALPITIVILLVVFGALVAAAVPMILSIAAIIVALGLTALVGNLMDLSFYVENMIFMIGFAVGIDYALFIISRYREERSHGDRKVGGDRRDRTHRQQGRSLLRLDRRRCALRHVADAVDDLPQPWHRCRAGRRRRGHCHAYLDPGGAEPAGRPRRLAASRKYSDVPVVTTARWDDDTVHKGFWGRVTRVVMRHPAIAAMLAIVLLGCGRHSVLPA